MACLHRGHLARLLVEMTVHMQTLELNNNNTILSKSKSLREKGEKRKGKEGGGGGGGGRHVASQHPA